MNSVDRQRRKFFPDRAGFSLVEIMVVILLMGIIAGISTPPLFKYLASTRLQTSSDRMIADLQYTRTRAISNGTVLRFSTTIDGYTVINPSTNEVIRTRVFSEGMTLDVVQSTDFFPWGMANSMDFVLASGGESRQISVLPTGMVEMP